MLTPSPPRFRTCAGEVIGYMSNNHIDPELATEVFVFEPLPARTYKLRHGRIFREGKTAWTKLHRAWLARLLCFDAAVEIECKFLVPELPRASSGRPRRGSNRASSRSPATAPRFVFGGREGRCALTVKGGSGLSRTEEEIAIDAERFARLWPLTEGRRVEKTRHLIPVGVRGRARGREGS